jgi:alpha-ribazole phosphatase
MDTLTKLLIVRHGNTEFNSARRFQGHSDIELSAIGYRQAGRLRDRLAAEKIDIIYSSDMRRALTTAELISSGHKASIITCPELREINYGKLEGLTFEEISRLYPEVAAWCVNWSPQLKFPSGESFDELKERVSRFLSRLKKHTEEQTMLIVAHGGPLRLLLCYLLEIDLWHWRQFQLNVASLSIVETYPEIAVISLLNDTSHLR